MALILVKNVIDNLFFAVVHQIIPLRSFKQISFKAVIV